jgi:hypothetical protein
MRFWFFYAIIVLASVVVGCKKTKNELPEINTVVVSLITPKSASCTAKVIGSEIVEKGICWNTIQSASISDNNVAGIDNKDATGFTGTLTGLLSNTTYYARAYAIGGGGTVYGNELTFTTPVDHTGEKGSVTDIDGNSYQTVGIGSQIWTSANLRTTKLNDSTHIIYGQCYRCWNFLKSPGYCWYDNYEPNKNEYGGLYNWYSVKTNKLCPSGWHVPGDEEWALLVSYLGDINPAIELTAVAGGFRGNLSEFIGINDNCIFWTSTLASSENAVFHALTLNKLQFSRGVYPLIWGASVRCVKD